MLPRHALAYLFAAFISIGLFAYLTTLTPYLLEVNLGLPKNQQGTVSGNLQFWQEIVMLALIGWWGAVSDRVGVYGVALAALSGVLASVLADYAHDDSRGLFTGISLLLNGVGAVLFFMVLTRLPDFYANSHWFAARGADSLHAGRYAYWTVAGIALLAACVMLGLKPGPPDAVRKSATLVELLRDGLAAGRKPRIAVSYIGAFAARADMAVINLFITLWIVQAATSTGVTPEQAIAKAGMITGLALAASMLWSPLFGLIADRIDRLTLLCVGYLLAAVGYGWVAALDDILSPAAIPALVCLGIGQSSTILSSSVLLAQEAPGDIRGSIFGLQTLCGAVGILALSAGGGLLFDRLGPHAPIVAVSVANGMVLLIAAGIRLRERQSRGLPATGRARS
ncbi:MAG: MFS transporter [Gammaproteobacteria bacterium PRO9]|nr:MFS transporter [Gammaproteobacteria bacterium PRO9]